MVFLCFLGFSAFGLNVKGTLKKNTTWKASQNPIIISGHIEIPESVTLTIEPGSIIKFDGYYRFLVKGTLEASGAPNYPVEFVSNKEKPAAEDWEGIIFYGEKSGGFLSHCRVKHAFKNMLWKSAPTIQNCIFSQNNYSLYCSFSKTAKILENQFIHSSIGIYCDYSSPIIQKNRIMNNEYGIYCVLSSAPIVGENEIVSNREKNIHMDDSMGKNEGENVNNHVWELMKGLF
jgi:parallel beta-helix repeat protein